MTPEEQYLEHRRLQELTHHNLIRLLDSELSLGLTMTRLAQTEAELGDKSHAKGLLEKVEQAMEVVRRHLAANHVSDDEKREMESLVQELTKLWNAAKQHVHDQPAGRPGGIV
jgi:hypothetical protein